MVMFFPKQQESSDKNEEDDDVEDDNKPLQRKKKRLISEISSDEDERQSKEHTPTPSKKRRLNSDISDNEAVKEEIEHDVEQGIEQSVEEKRDQLTTAPRGDGELRTVCLDGLTSNSLLLERAHGNAEWMIHVPGHGRRIISLFGRGVRQLRVRHLGTDPEGADIHVMIAHLRVHFPILFHS